MSIWIWILLGLIMVVVVFIAANGVLSWLGWHVGSTVSLTRIAEPIWTLVHAGHGYAKLRLESEAQPQHHVDLVKTTARKRQACVRAIARVRVANPTEFDILKRLLAQEELSHELRNRRRYKIVLIESDANAKSVERVCRLFFEDLWGLPPASVMRCRMIGGFDAPTVLRNPHTMLLL
ncbi:MAG: hypothetical protein SYC29_10290 [Planctomycetota bacterium]|nr:hypothetical protein [Planctomycetota bacterium]